MSDAVEPAQAEAEPRLDRLAHRLRRDRAKAKLKGMLELAAPEEFLAMIWGADALVGGRVLAASRVLTFPPEAAAAKIDSPMRVHEWELESLVSHYLSFGWKNGKLRLRCDHIQTVFNITQQLRNLENSEYVVMNDPVNVMTELNRIGHRQFPWQRGYLNIPDFYRSLYLYGQGGCADYFEQRYGLPVSQFVMLGAAMCGQLQTRPFARRYNNYSELGLSGTQAEAGLSLLTIPLKDAKRARVDLIGKSNAQQWPSAYKPSLLRQRPIIATGADCENLWAPLPQLIMQRVTFGLYYDLVAPGGSLRNEIASRFEQYCINLLKELMPTLVVQAEHQYRGPSRGSNMLSPDILISHGGRMVMVVECKASKLSVAAQYSSDPAVDAKSRYEEIGRGIFQLWRYFAHCRLGLTGHTPEPNAPGVLLTLDTWLHVSPKLRDHVMTVATTLADSDGAIAEEDRRPIAYMTVQALEAVLGRSDESRFISTIELAASDAYRGWAVPLIKDDRLGEPSEQKRYPFDPGQLLPWWDMLGSPPSAAV